MSLVDKQERTKEMATKKDRAGYTEDDYLKALDVFRYYRMELAKELEKLERAGYKLPRKEGIKYVRCQHLKEKTQEAEQAIWWLGDNLRVVACPICQKTHAGNFLAQVFTYIRRNDPEVREILERGDDALDRYKFFNETEKNESFFKRLLGKSEWARRLFPSEWFE
jgi:hypothetical protein